MFEIKQTDTFRNWLTKLKDRQARALISARVYRLASGLGDVVSVGGGVSEMRIHYGPGYRVYFRRRGTQIILLLCGGDKSTQTQDIAQAKKLAATWEE